jgi:hypothetical protein
MTKSSESLGVDREGSTASSRTRSEIIAGIEWYTVDAGPLDQDDFTDCQCARCGSSAAFVDCWNCGGEGETEEPDTEDYGNEYYWRHCEYCDGKGGRWRCISTPEWCEAHPNPAREHIESTAMKSEDWSE